MTRTSIYLVFIVCMVAHWAALYVLAKRQRVLKRHADAGANVDIRLSPGSLKDMVRTFGTIYGVTYRDLPTSLRAALWVCRLGLLIGLLVFFTSFFALP